MKKLRPVDIHRAIRTVLSINYRYVLLDVAITELTIEWYTAVQFRRDDSRTWHPRIILYSKKSGRVAIMNRLGDREPTWVDVQTLMAMAEMKAVSPPTGGNIG